MAAKLFPQTTEIGLCETGEWLEGDIGHKIIELGWSNVGFCSTQSLLNVTFLFEGRIIYC